MKYKSYLDEALSGPSPCDGCTYYEECKTERKACVHFLEYQEYGIWHRNLPKNPTREIFDQIFEEDEELKVTRSR